MNLKSMKALSWNGPWKNCLSILSDICSLLWKLNGLPNNRKHINLYFPPPSNSFTEMLQVNFIFHSKKSLIANNKLVLQLQFYQIAKVATGDIWFRYYFMLMRITIENYLDFALFYLTNVMMWCKIVHFSSCHRFVHHQ